MPEHSLFPTKHRKAFLRAVAVPGRVVGYRSSKEAWDNVAALQVTARLQEAFDAGWVEPIPHADLWPGAKSRDQVIYFRLTVAGKKLIEEKSNG